MLALLLIFYEVIQVARGTLYEKNLGSIDRTTLIELGILALVGVFAFRNQTDLQAVSFTLVAGLSFIFLYEAIYKWSFYRAPFDENHPMPPEEVREFVIQVGIAASVLTGFAVGLFTLRQWLWLWLGLFGLLWIFWILIGFPQITGEMIFPNVVGIDLGPGMVYLLNRSTKTVLFLAYLSILQPVARRNTT